MSDVLAFLLICLFVAAVLGSIAWCIADQLPKGDWFNEAVGRGVASGLATALAPGGLIDAQIKEAADQVWREAALANRRVSGPLTSTQFVWQMAFHMMRTDPTMRASSARDLSLGALRDLLRDEKIKFGAEGWAWDQGAAETIAREYETDHWEARP